ncbi:hypothetical protein Tco_1403353 [Tanacetum coccineum]
MRSDELYKFCDGTLTFVRRVLHDIANNLRMDYLPKRRWSNLDRKRSRIMIKAIDQQLFERRLIRNLEKFVGDSLKDGHGGTLVPSWTQRFIATCSYSANKSKDIMKSQVLVSRLPLLRYHGYTRFQHQEQYEHVGPEVTRSQEGKRSQDDDKRLCLVDDLKEVQVHIQVKPIRTSSSLKS